MTSPTYPVSIAQQDSPLRLSGDELAVSVIIPVYNGGPNFRKCLVSVKALLPSPAEVIVVGDGDTDGSSQLAEEFDVNAPAAGDRFKQLAEFRNLVVVLQT